MAQQKPIVLVGNPTSDLKPGDDVGDVSYWQVQALTAAQKEQAAGNGGFVRNGSGVGQTTANAIKLGQGSGSSYPRITVDATDFGRLWCDAAVQFNNAQNGAIKFPDGYTRQWGYDAGNNGDHNVTFPVAFTSLFRVSAKLLGRSTSTLQILDAQIDNQSATGFSVGPRYLNNGSATVGVAAQSIYWEAEGYITP